MLSANSDCVVGNGEHTDTCFDVYDELVRGVVYVDIHSNVDITHEYRYVLHSQHTILMSINR